MAPKRSDTSEEFPVSFERNRHNRTSGSRRRNENNQSSLSVIDPHTPDNNNPHQDGNIQRGYTNFDENIGTSSVMEERRHQSDTEGSQDLGEQQEEEQQEEHEQQTDGNVIEIENKQASKKRKRGGDPDDPDVAYSPPKKGTAAKKRPSRKNTPAEEHGDSDDNDETKVSASLWIGTSCPYCF